MKTIKEWSEELYKENNTLWEDKEYWKKLAEKRKGQLQQKENIIKEVREEVRILESNCDISNYHAQKLYQTLDKEGVN